MYLTRHKVENGARWALDGRYLPEGVTLGLLLELPQADLHNVLKALLTAEEANGPLIAPLEPFHEVWASGVTYLRSRDARKSESEVADVYDKVYEAERPEIFFKATGWRVSGQDAPIRIRRDSRWNVPEPELVLVLNAHFEIVGYCAGNDVSSRDIEGENPLYLPQAKVYDGSCALGPGIRLTNEALNDLSISLEISRQGKVMFEDETSTSQMKRSFAELARCLGDELSFPQGVFLMTGTSLVPPDTFRLEAGDAVSITVGEASLSNTVAS